MTKRSIIITVVVLALVQGTLGNIVAAAFCPRFASGHECPMHMQLDPLSAHDNSNHSIKLESQENAGSQETTTMHSCHSGSASDAEVPATTTTDRQQESNPAVMGYADEACSHCISHSQTNPGRYSATSGDPTSSSVETELPLIALDNFDFSGARPLRTLDHGPPGQLSARLALLNTFRI
jgi:hypothetical protein